MTAKLYPLGIDTLFAYDHSQLQMIPKTIALFDLQRVITSLSSPVLVTCHSWLATFPMTCLFPGGPTTS